MDGTCGLPLLAGSPCARILRALNTLLISVRRDLQDGADGKDPGTLKLNVASCRSATVAVGLRSTNHAGFASACADKNDFGAISSASPA